jgi:hypothetical protein
MPQQLTLEEIAKRAREHTLTPSERRAQRVSLMMGLQSKNSCWTREEVESFLDQNEGHETKDAKADRLPKAALAMIDDLVGSIYGTNRGEVARSLIIAHLQALSAQKVIVLRQSKDVE